MGNIYRGKALGVHEYEKESCPFITIKENNGCTQFFKHVKQNNSVGYDYIHDSCSETSNKQYQKH